MCARARRQISRTLPAPGNAGRTCLEAWKASGDERTWEILDFYWLLRLLRRHFFVAAVCVYTGTERHLAETSHRWPDIRPDIFTWNSRKTSANKCVFPLVGFLTTGRNREGGGKYWNVLATIVYLICPKSPVISQKHIHTVIRDVGNNIKSKPQNDKKNKKKFISSRNKSGGKITAHLLCIGPRCSAVHNVLLNVFTL